MNKQLMDRLRQFLFKEGNKTLVGLPATVDEIQKAEEILNVTFDGDYVEFISTFGGAYAGLPVHAFANSEMLSNQTVQDLTLEYRKSYQHDDICPEIQESYVISIDGNGDPIMINRAGEVLICYHDSGETETIASSFEELIQNEFKEW